MRVMLRAVVLCSFTIVISSLSFAAGTAGFSTLKKSAYCLQEGRYIGLQTAYSGWYYTDSTGVKHTFPSGDTSYSYYGAGVCSTYTSGFVATVSTQGGYYTLTTNGSSGNVVPTATLFPRYHILSLLYDAPGNQSSNSFTDTTFYGTTSNIGSSFSSGITFTFSASGGLFGIGGGTSSSVGLTLGYGTTDSFTDTIYSGEGLTLKSSRNPIDHTNDTFWIWLNPEVDISQTGSAAATYAVSPPTGQVMDAVRVSVAELQTPSKIPLPVLEPITINGVVYPGLSNICANPLPPSKCTQSNACGCVPADFTQILGTDPIISITKNTPPSQIDSERYVELNPQPSPFPYLEYGTPETINVTDQSQTGQTQTQTTEYQATYSTTFGSKVQAFPVDWTLQETIKHTFTWTQTVALTNFSGTQHQMQLILGTSTSSCAAAIDVFEDYDYHTMVESYASTPPTGCDSN